MHQLAELLRDNIAEAMETIPYDTFTMLYPGTTNTDYWGILRNSVNNGVKDCIIIEHGFHTNLYDATQLLSDRILNRIADATVSTLCKFYNIKPQEPPRAYAVGDINKDGKVDVKDLTALLNILSYGNKSYDGFADINDDGTIDIRDVTSLTNILAGVKKDTTPPTSQSKPKDTIPDTIPDPVKPNKTNYSDTLPDTLPPTAPDTVKDIKNKNDTIVFTETYPPTTPDTLPPTGPDGLDP